MWGVFLNLPAPAPFGRQDWGAGRGSLWHAYMKVQWGTGARRAEVRSGPEPGAGVVAVVGAPRPGSAASALCARAEWGRCVCAQGCTD